MDARKQALRGLLALSPRPHSKPEFEDVIRTAVVAQDEAKGASSSADTRRGVWEYVLRQEVLALAVCKPSSHESTYLLICVPRLGKATS
jgi:hypothetical protein